MSEIVKDLDFWRMAAMGMFLKSVVWGKEEAAMYSYNGTVLPALPETELPYAVITYRAERTDMLGYAFTTHTWWLHLVSTIELFDADSGAAFVVNEGDQYYKMKWIENDDGTTSGTKTDWGEVQDHTAGNTILLSEAIWSNTNLYSTDGSLALAASDPIPVYE